LNKSFRAFPLGRASLDSIRIPNDNGSSFAYFDRTAFISLLHGKGIQPVVRALRPKRFGKSLFVNTLKLFHDCALPEDEFVKVFKVCMTAFFDSKKKKKLAELHTHQNTAVMNDVEAGKIKRGQYLILDLDFSKFSDKSIAQIEAKIRNYVNQQIRNIWVKYAYHLGPPVIGPVPNTVMAVNDSDCVLSLDHLVQRVEEKWSPEKPFAVWIFCFS
jgi:hypothetical protein